MSRTLRTQPFAAVSTVDKVLKVRVTKYICPARHQRVLLIPVPLYATPSFFEDWVKQPYIKENTLCYNGDLLQPGSRIVTDYLETETATHFSFRFFPKAELLDISPDRADTLHIDIGPSVFQRFLLLPSRRLRSGKTVLKKLAAVLGSPIQEASEAKRGVVIMVTAEQAVAVHELLISTYGFAEESFIEVEAGGADAVDLSWKGLIVADVVQAILILNLLILISGLFYQVHLDVQQEAARLKAAHMQKVEE